MIRIPAICALALLLAGCAAIPDTSDGKLPEEGAQAARYVAQYCALDEQGRNGQSEALRRALWPRAQFIILCDH
jgi:hypothetical protein